MNRMIVVCGLVAALGCGGSKGGDKTGTGEGGGDAAGTAGTAGTMGAAGSGGSGACVTGAESCACYGNGTCDVGLQCLSHLCVSPTGTGGSAVGTAGTTGNGGTTGSAGTTGAGGSAAGTSGTAGTTGIAGATGTAGTTGSGGTGACAIGSEGCACYGNDTCNGSLRCLSHLCVSLGGTGGTTGTAGTTGSAGTTGTGGGAAGRGGTTGSGGTTGTGGGAGNTLLFTAGVVTPGSNTFGISGGIYSFTDGAGSTITPDCSTDTCFGDVTGVGPICVAGTGARVLSNGVSYDYATYWGSALAMDLNNPTNAAMAQMAYKASDHGVTGFQFTFQNKASSTVRLSYKVRDPGTSALLEYCLDLTTSTSTVHFTDAHQSCYLPTPGPALTAAMADHIEGIQWQVPTNIAAATPFSYCISNLTPITQ